MLVVQVAGSKTPVIKACISSFIDKQKEYAELYQEQLPEYYAVKKAYDYEIKKVENDKKLDIDSKTKKIIALT